MSVGFGIDSPRYEHGHAIGGGTPEYQAWSNMRRRCYDPRSSRFNAYGARGITVCDRWKKSFKNFLADMGLKPSPDHSIERRDNNGNYDPSNCYWATDIEQQANTQKSRSLEFEGRKQTYAQWARATGLSPSLIHHRVKMGWSAERILRTKPNPKQTGRPAK